MKLTENTIFITGGGTDATTKANPGMDSVETRTTGIVLLKSPL